MNGAAVEIRNLHKTYRVKWSGPVQAVRGVSLSVEPGRIFGFLGPNGAGKTTVIRCALGLLPYEQGEILLFGERPADRRSLFARVGYCPDSFDFPGELSCARHLRFFCRLLGMDKAGADRKTRDLLERLGLAQVADRPCNTLSAGTRQRFSIAQALVNDPQLLFLDEPTQGLDPIGVGELRVLLRELADRGTAVFLNSHQLAEVEKVCDRVGILNEGLIVREDTVDALLEAGGLENYFINVVKGG